MLSDSLLPFSKLANQILRLHSFISLNQGCMAYFTSFGSRDSWKLIFLRYNFLLKLSNCYVKTSTTVFKREMCCLKTKKKFDIKITLSDFSLDILLKKTRLKHWRLHVSQESKRKKKKKKTKLSNLVQFYFRDTTSNQNFI